MNGSVEMVRTSLLGSVQIFAIVFLTACGGETTKDTATETPAEVSTPVAQLPETPADVASPPKDAKKAKTGMFQKVLKSGTGKERPSSKSLVTVHYTGWTTDGKMFDSSMKRGHPAQFVLNQVIKGWAEGLQLMVEGEKRRFWIPSEMAFGEKPQGGQPAGMLVFDIELLEVRNPPERLDTPPDDVTRTKSGLTYKVLSAGKRGPHPTTDDRVHVHFIGWTSKGDLIRSSYGQPSPPAFQLRDAVSGWQEAIQLMRVGEKARFWIPDHLGQITGDPDGMAIFDFELLEIEKPIPAPVDVAAPPSDATTTESGLAYRVLVKGKGTKKPTKTNAVKYNYTAWTAVDGKMFDTTVYISHPAVLDMASADLKGLKEGLSDMVVGEKRRLWIPERLAFVTHPPLSKGTIVYDVELVDISTAPSEGLSPQMREHFDNANITVPPSLIASDATGQADGFCWGASSCSAVASPWCGRDDERNRTCVSRDGCWWGSDLAGSLCNGCNETQGGAFHPCSYYTTEPRCAAQGGCFWQPFNSAECVADQDDCGDGRVCVGGRCRKGNCVRDSDCTSNDACGRHRRCRGNWCEPFLAPDGCRCAYWWHCQNACNWGACGPRQFGNAKCDDDDDCLSGICGDDGNVAPGGVCRCLADDQCVQGARCRTEDNACVPTAAPNGTPCDRDGQCLEACIDGICQPRRLAHQNCGNHADCRSCYCGWDLFRGTCSCITHDDCPNVWEACSSSLYGIPNPDWKCHPQPFQVWSYPRRPSPETCER